MFYPQHRVPGACSGDLLQTHLHQPPSLPFLTPTSPPRASWGHFPGQLHPGSPSPLRWAVHAWGNQILRESLQHSETKGWVKSSTISLAGSITGQLWPTCEINSGVLLFRCDILLLRPPHLQTLAQAQLFLFSLDFTNFIVHL